MSVISGFDLIQDKRARTYQIKSVTVSLQYHHLFIVAHRRRVILA